MKQGSLRGRGSGAAAVAARKALPNTRLSRERDRASARSSASLSEESLFSDPARKKWARARVALLAVLLLGGAGAVVRRAYQLQVENAPTLRALAEDQYLREIRFSPRRGTIYDRNGAELAVSVDVDSIWANPREMRAAGIRVDVVAQQLAPILGMNAQTLYNRLSTDRLFVWLKRRVTPHEASQIDALGIVGIASSKESRRFYPNRDLASHVLGFTDVDGKGIEGVELQFEETLRGSVAAVPAIRDRRGNVVFSEQLLDDRASQGDDITLTIDKTIQHVAEQEIALAVGTYEAKAGSVVVMDPRNGEILALANYPSFNPNEPGASPATAHRNRAITDRFEPGSVLKPFTIAGALQAGAIRPTQLFDCEQGAFRVAEYTIHDSHPWGLLTPAQILARSSNIGTLKIGTSLGRAGLYRTLRRFGFGEKTGIELSGEAAGILRPHQRWYEMDAATISFGQGMSVTAIQLAAAMSAIANGGQLLQPTVIRRIASPAGQVLRESSARLRETSATSAVARTVAGMLASATGPEGTGYEASVDGYVVAGKTGTPQKADYVHGGYADDLWISNFVGFAPVSRPRLVIAVIIDEPMVAHLGGAVAAPVFRRIAGTSLRHLGVPPSSVSDPVQRVARARASEASLHETPTPVATLAEVTPPEGGETRVPDFTGAGARRVLVMADRAGLRAQLEGSGKAVAQSPSPGTIVSPHSVVSIRLERPRARVVEAEPSELALSGSGDAQ